MTVRSVSVRFALSSCHHFNDERSKIIKKIKPQNTTLKTLSETTEGIENLVRFLIETECWGHIKGMEKDDGLLQRPKPSICYGKSMKKEGA
jgi:hypothetical protein